MIGPVSRHRGSQENNFLWPRELSESGQGDEGVGHRKHGVQNAGDVFGLTGLDTANGVRALKPCHCLSNTPVVVRAVEGQASESSLDIKAALILRACVCSCHTFINILAASSVGSQGVSIDWTGTVEAARCVVTAIGANVTSSGQGTLIYVFTSHAIYVTELVATATVTLV